MPITPAEAGGSLLLIKFKTIQGYIVDPVSKTKQRTNNSFSNLLVLTTHKPNPPVPSKTMIFKVVRHRQQE